MMQSIKISIAGIQVSITKRSADRLNGINIGERLSFDFYDGTFKGVNMLFVKPKSTNPTPKKCSVISERLSMLFDMPIVFILSPSRTYERQRLIEKDVYFVMSDRYAYFPMLVSAERTTNRKKPNRLSPVAQYLLLYHLQIENIERKSTKAIATMMPYSYESVSTGLTCLSGIGLCTKINIDSRRKAIQFNSCGKQLWEDAKPFMTNPVETRIYCDGINLDRQFPICGINALSRYSMLNPDPEQWVVMSAKDFRDINAANAIVNPNEFDGSTIIEIWKYPVVTELNSKAECVDKLSLALSLKDNNDPRVEQAVEQMINNFKWLD